MEQSFIQVKDVQQMLKGVVSSFLLCAHHATRHITPIHYIPLTAPQLSISQKALGMLPDDGNVMPIHVAATMHN
jgi:hypothetical protein